PESKAHVEGKVKHDYRHNQMSDSRVDNLKKKYQIQALPEKLSYFESILPDAYFQRKWELPEDFNGSQQLFSIEGKPVLYEEFGNFILRSQRKPTPKKDYKVLVNELYTQYLKAKLLAYQEQNLENDNEE